MDIDKILKILFILSLTAFLVTFVSVPKNHCQACELNYGEEKIDGIEAYEIFADRCFSLEKEIPDGEVIITGEE